MTGLSRETWEKSVSYTHLDVYKRQVIGLPANLFYNTSIPTCIIVLKKHRDGRDVLFIDASKKFDKGKKQNAMTDEHIDAVMELYSKRETVEKESYRCV